MAVVTRSNNDLTKTLTTPELYGILTTADATYCTSKYSDLSALNSVVGSNNCTIVVDSSVTISADTTIGTGGILTGASLVVQKGGQFVVATTKTLTIDTSFQAGLFQCFNCVGTGSVVFSAGAVSDVYPEWWGAIADGTTNCTSAFNAAIASKLPVVLSSGTYKANAVTPSGTTGGLVMSGAGSRSTFLTPYDNSKAALTYNYTTSWAYQSQITGIQFLGASKTGVGFTCGATSTSDYTVGMEYIANIRFVGCLFMQLEKGVQFPFGNIGSTFIDCGWSFNKYGVYAINNKFGGDKMQTGIKYFYAGQFNNNECAVYIHDTTDEGGGWSFKDTVIQYNLIALYINSTSRMFTPVKVDSCWVEQNGTSLTSWQTYPDETPSVSTPANVTLDTWTGSTKSTASYPRKTLRVDGSTNFIVWENSFFGDATVTATASTILVKSCRVEDTTGFTGGPCLIDSTSSVIIENCFTAGNFSQGLGFDITGSQRKIYASTMDSSSSNAQTRWNLSEHRTTKCAGYSDNKILSIPFTSGIAIPSATQTIVSDGLLYNTCCHYVKAGFTGSDWSAVASTSFTPAVGWYVFTVDIKTISGDPRFSLWDRSTQQAFLYATTPDHAGGWYTVASIFYSESTSGTLQLDVVGPAVTADCTWRMSALQLMVFNTELQARSYLNSRVYAEA